MQIGPYLLIACVTPGDTDVLGVMQDSLGSEAVHLTDYGTPQLSEGANCSRVVDPVRGEFSSITCNLFNNWHYIIVRYDSLSEDYQVTIDRYVKYDGISEVDESELYTMTGIDGKTDLYQHTLNHKYTYEDIQTALARECD